MTYFYYSDATMSTGVGTCVYNYRCMGYNWCGGTTSPYYTVTVDECPH